MNDVWTLFLVFTVYSFIGWLTESIFCSIPEGKFINRGFLSGPFCPIYGVGGVLVIIILEPFENNLILLYIAGVVVTTLVEYITGFALEKIFHTKYWDYSDHKFNLQGRICLENSLLFGVMCLVGIHTVQPRLIRLVAMIPDNIMPVIDIVLMLYFIFDTALSVNTMYQLNGKLDEVQQIINEMKQKASVAKTETIENIQAKVSSLLDEDTAAYLNGLLEKLENLEANSKMMQRRLLSAFPTMKSVTNNESLQHLKTTVFEKARMIRKSKKESDTK